MNVIVLNGSPKIDASFSLRDIRLTLRRFFVWNESFGLTTPGPGINHPCVIPAVQIALS